MPFGKQNQKRVRLGLAKSGSSLKWFGMKRLLVGVFTILETLISIKPVSLCHVPGADPRANCAEGCYR